MNKASAAAMKLAREKAKYRAWKGASADPLPLAGLAAAETLAGEPLAMSGLMRAEGAEFLV